MRHHLRYPVRFALDAFARGVDITQPALVEGHGLSPGCARTDCETPRHSARSTRRTLKHRTCPGAITPKHKLGTERPSTSALDQLQSGPCSLGVTRCPCSSNP